MKQWVTAARTNPISDELVRVAMRVLWAWARKHEQASMPMPMYHQYISKVDGGVCDQWRVPIPYADGDGTYRGIKIEVYISPETATVALAEALVQQDPSLLPDQGGELLGKFAVQP